MRDEGDLAGVESDICGGAQPPHIAQCVRGIFGTQGRRAECSRRCISAEHGDEFPKVDGVVGAHTEGDHVCDIAFSTLAGQAAGAVVTLGAARCDHAGPP